MIQTFIKWINNKRSRPFELFVQKHSDGYLTGAEIGVWKGEHALSMLKRLKIAKLYLVDPFKLYPTKDERDDKSFLRQEDIDAAKRVLLKRIKFKKAAQLMELTSVTASQSIPDELDFVYLDAAHDELNIRQDIAAWWPKVKAGGIFGGHDFNEHWTCIINEVIKFVTQEKLQLYTNREDWWVIKPKK